MKKKTVYIVLNLQKVISAKVVQSKCPSNQQEVYIEQEVYRTGSI